MSVRVEAPPIAAEASARSRVAAPGGEAAGRSPGHAWGLLAVVASILAASGGVRGWQERRVERTLSEGRVAPFSLAAIPMKLGDWEGRPTTLDPRIVRASGSTDLIVRRYVDGATGTAVDVVVNFGPTSDMFIHVPELCYPSAGFEPAGPAAERQIVSAGGPASVPFRSLAYAKGGETQEVYYSLRYDGRWTTASTSPKASKRIGGMYKVQLSRRVAAGERRDIDNPAEPFLGLLVGEIESRIAGGPSPGP